MKKYISAYKAISLAGFSGYAHLTLRLKRWSSLLLTIMLLNSPLYAATYLSKAATADLNQIKNIKGRTDLHMACWEGDLKKVKAQLSIGATVNQPDKYGKSPLYIACERGYTAIVKALLDCDNIDVNQAINGGWTPLYIACRNNHSDIVDLLLNDQRVYTNHPKKCGQSPLYIACKKRNIDIVEQLLGANKGVNVNQADKDGRSPLYIASWLGSRRLVDILLKEHELNVNQQTVSGDSPLHTACENGCIGVVDLLLTHLELDLNQANGNGETPLYVACRNGNIRLVEILLNQPKIAIYKPLIGCAGSKTTPYQIAEQLGYTAILQLFEDKGYNPHEDRLNKAPTTNSRSFYKA